jgi:hypothetical protein
MEDLGSTAAKLPGQVAQNLCGASKVLLDDFLILTGNGNFHFFSFCWTLSAQMLCNAESWNDNSSKS